jgi:hypothetical protein
MFADIYVLIDGDDTYDASVAPDMTAQMIADSANVMTGRRIQTQAAAYRPGHVFGNKMLTGLTALLFNVHLSGMLRGYRIFSREVLSLHRGRLRYRDGADHPCRAAE